MIRLDTAPTPNGRKVSMALEESGLPCEGIPVRIDRGEPVRPEFRARNPNPTIPVLEDDGQAIWESGAILFHLGQRHDPGHRILPGDPRRRMEAVRYAFFQTGGIGPNLGRRGQALRAEEKDEERIRIFAAEGDRLLGVLERLPSDGRPHLAGEDSTGDIPHDPWLRDPDDLRAPELLTRRRMGSWPERIAERPAVARGRAVPG